MSERNAVGIVGVGWVGLVTAACFSDLGNEIVALDPVALRSGQSRRPAGNATTAEIDATWAIFSR